MGRVTVLDDPAAGLQLAALRDARTAPQGFREHARLLGAMLTIRAVNDHVPIATGEVRTPLAPATTTVPACGVVAVPVLRAGLGLLPGVHDVLADAQVGMVGLERDPETLKARHYYRNVPPVDGAWVLVLEPMLATGGSAADAISALGGSPRGVSVLSVVGTATAIERIHRAHPDVEIVIGGVDERLDDDGYIVPGLGDFGDRLFGTPH